MTGQSVGEECLGSVVAPTQGEHAELLRGPRQAFAVGHLRRQVAGLPEQIAGGLGVALVSSDDAEAE